MLISFSIYHDIEHHQSKKNANNECVCNGNFFCYYKLQLVFNYEFLFSSISVCFLHLTVCSLIHFQSSSSHQNVIIFFQLYYFFDYGIKQSQFNFDLNKKIVCEQKKKQKLTNQFDCIANFLHRPKNCSKETKFSLFFSLLGCYLINQLFFLFFVLKTIQKNLTHCMRFSS